MNVPSFHVHREVFFSFNNAVTDAIFGGISNFGIICSCLGLFVVTKIVIGKFVCFGSDFGQLTFVSLLLRKINSVSFSVVRAGDHSTFWWFDLKKDFFMVGFYTFCRS